MLQKLAPERAVHAAAVSMCWICCFFESQGNTAADAMLQGC
jgi:hypothetical protein